MQATVDLLNEKELKYADELFFAEGEFFAIHDGKIAKLPDFTVISKEYTNCYRQPSVLLPHISLQTTLT